MTQSQDAVTTSGPEGSIFLSKSQHSREQQAILLGRGPVASALRDVSESEVAEFVQGHVDLLDMRARLTIRLRPDIWE